MRVARIFNTFGPRMHMADGRVVSNFILQCLQNQDITVSNDIIFFHVQIYDNGLECESLMLLFSSCSDI